MEFLCYKFFTPGKHGFSMIVLDAELTKSPRQLQTEVNLANTLKARENPAKHLRRHFVFQLIGWLDNTSFLIG